MPLLRRRGLDPAAAVAEWPAKLDVAAEGPSLAHLAQVLQAHTFHLALPFFVSCFPFRPHVIFTNVSLLGRTGG